MFMLFFIRGKRTMKNITLKKYRNKKKAISIALVFYFLISPLLFSSQVDTCTSGCPIHAKHMLDGGQNNMHNQESGKCEMMGNIDMQSNYENQFALPTCRHDSRLNTDAEIITYNRIIISLDVQSYISYDFLRNNLTSAGKYLFLLSSDKRPEQIPIIKTVLRI